MKRMSKKKSREFSGFLVRVEKERRLDRWAFLFYLFFIFNSDEGNMEKGDRWALNSLYIRRTT
jgi:hypothetical protein